MTDMKLIIIFHKKAISSQFYYSGRLATRSIFVIISTGVITCYHGQRSTSIAEQSYTENVNGDGIAVWPSGAV